MMAARIHTVTVLFIFFCHITAASRDEIRFESFTLEQGLSQNSVLCILQDQRGFLWLGTEDGLNKYDGYKFTIYRYQPLDSNSLSDSYITAFCEDDSGRLWIGTKDGGLNHFDLKTGRIRHWRHDPENDHSLSANHILSIYIDRAGALWCGTYGAGLNRYVPEKETFIRYQHSANDSSSISNNYIYEILEDHRGNLWFATYDGLSCLTPSNRETGKFTNYYSDPDNSHSLSHNQIWSLCESRQGEDTLLWIGTHNGLNCYRPESDSFTRYYPEPQKSEGLSNSINSIIQDNSGKKAGLWLGTYKGLFFFDLREANRASTAQATLFSSYFQEINNPNSLSENLVASLFQDRSGSLWIGTYGGGVNKYSPQKQKFKLWRKQAGNPNSLSHNGVHAVCESDEGTLWIGTNEGLNRLNLSTGQFKHYLHNPKNSNSPEANYIAALCPGKDGELWLGTYGGGVSRMRWDEHGKAKFHHWRGDAGQLTQNYILSLCQDQSGLLWIGTWGGGLNCLNPQTGKVRYWVNDPADPRSLSYNDVWCIYEDRKERLWIGTYGGGLNLYDRQKNRFYRWQPAIDEPNSLSNNTVYSIYQPGNEAGNILWIGTAGGLDKMEFATPPGKRDFPPATVKFTHYREADGLPNNVVYGILEDRRGNLWLSTNKGISCFNPRKITFKNYDRNDGLQSNEFNAGAYYKSVSGMMFFGGVNGLNGFYPDSLKDNRYLPPVVITDFQLFNKPVKIGGASSLQAPITETKEIILSYKQNIFSFEFAALDYTAPEKNRYAYKMEGFEEDWNYVTRRFASYTGLPPGEYTFRVIGSNNDGLWNREGTAIRIIITPPPWKTGWAYLIYTILFLTAVASWRKHDLKKRRRQEEERLLRAQEESELREARLRAQSAEFEAKAAKAEQEIEKQQIRNRIARDLHDEIGSNLSSIKLISELMVNRSDLDQETHQYLSDIYEAARTSSEAIREIVWFINPESDQVSRLISKMKETATAMLKNIQFEFHSSEPAYNETLNPKVRRNLFLIYKEILNNVIKHSRATRVEIDIREERGAFDLSVKDNGVGFDQSADHPGQGLKNMENRLAEMGSQLSIETSPGNGTRITVVVKKA